ncbi:hypothetical protein VNI00_017015 [Paramarasmius palmivorus]|uniref:CCHC-type domain-containing protein n=1 Tax=Paramarasmius palmivorus TaxID=297713 RepID=A0AAW0BC30_9AGAR
MPVTPTSLLQPLPTPREQIANDYYAETSLKTRRTANSSKPLQAFVDDPDRQRVEFSVPPQPLPRNPRDSTPSSPLSSPPSEPSVPSSTAQRTRLPSQSLSSSSDDSDSLTVPTTMSSSTTPGFSLGDYKTPPSVSCRSLSIEEILSFTLHVQRYCFSKGYVDREKQREVLTRCCQHRQSMTFFTSRKAAHDKLDDGKFLGEVFGHFAGRNWKEQVVEMIDNTKQEQMHDKSLQSLLDRLNELNDLLEGSDNHLDGNALRNKAYSACSKNFRKFLVVHDVTIALPYDEWVVKALAADEKYFEFQKEHDERLDSITSLLAAASHKRDLSFNSGNHYSSEQPRKQRAYQNTASSSSSSSTIPSASVAAVANADGRYECPSYQVAVRENPDLRALCNSTQMCHACWIFRPGHMRKDCPVAAQGLGPPSLEVPYCHINQADANFIREFTRNHGRPITLNAVLKARPLPVAAVHAVDDVTSLAPNTASGTSQTQASAPVWSNATAAVFNTHPVHHVAQGAAVFDQRAPPVNASRMSFPRAYSAPAVAAVIEPYDGDGSDDEFSEGSPSPRPAARMSTVARSVRNGSPAAVSIGSEDEVSEQPLRVPHFFWHTTLKGPKAELSLHVLMDDGSYLCIIRRDVAMAAGLRLERVQQPETTSGASGSLNTSYTHITKFRLRCPISKWKSRTVHAFVADSLCAPIILGRPFLKHNRIVTNHDSDTMINLDTGIDLMHPQPPSPATPVCTLSPKDKRLRICRIRLDVLKELKSRVNDGSLLLRPISRVSWKPTIVGVAPPVESIPCWAKNIRRRVESLARRDSLDRRAAAVKEEFSDVFHPCQLALYKVTW